MWSFLIQIPIKSFSKSYDLSMIIYKINNNNFRTRKMALHILNSETELKLDQTFLLIEKNFIQPFLLIERWYLTK